MILVACVHGSGYTIFQYLTAADKEKYTKYRKTSVHSIFVDRKKKAKTHIYKQYNMLFLSLFQSIIIYK